MIVLSGAFQLTVSIEFSFFRNEFLSLLTISIFSKINQKFQNNKNSQIPCPCVITIRLVDGHGTRCCVPRYLDDSYSGGNSIILNLKENYPVSAFTRSLSERVYSVEEKDAAQYRLFREESEMN